VGFLTEIVERVRADLSERPLDEATLMFRTRAVPPPRDFEGAMLAPGMTLIAEIKRASPSAGPIAEADPGGLAARYEAGGAGAISVLTEPRFFDGSLADLRLARRRTRLPLLRKDFLVHPAQVLQSRAEGADAVLLIAAALDPSELEDLLAVAGEVGMGAVVEAHSGEDLDRAVASGARVIGVNARDLESLEVDLERGLQLVRAVPDDRVVVLESGIASRADVVRADQAGAAAVLVGETLMRSPDPQAEIGRLLGVVAAASGGGQG
jgi:indole-3-glycerol phosphate synthase